MELCDYCNSKKLPKCALMEEAAMASDAIAIESKLYERERGTATPQRISEIDKRIEELRKEGQDLSIRQEKEAKERGCTFSQYFIMSS